MGIPRPLRNDWCGAQLMNVNVCVILGARMQASWALQLAIPLVHCVTGSYCFSHFNPTLDTTAYQTRRTFSSQIPIQLITVALL